MAQVPAGGDLHDHDHDHAGHDHAGHDRAAHGDHDHAAQTHDAREHLGHDHAGHDHAGHDHAGHDHAGHNHAGHNHAGHSHAGHHHAPTSFGKSFAIATVLNSAFVVIEFFYGFATHSTALMADAGHNLSDVLGLLLAWGAAVLASKTPTARYTYGFRRTTILAAIANAMLLLVSCGAIAWVALDRLFAPVAVLGETVSIVAAIGILINGGSALLFMSGSKSDLNVRGAYLHMAADAAVSLGVVVAGLIMLATGWFWIDPVVSLVIVAVIVAGTWGLLRDSICLGLDAVPPHIDQTSVRSYLRNLAGVADIHDLHIWGMSTTETALTAHLVMPSGSPGDQFLSQICASISRNFGISHVTIQIENGTVPCELAPDHVV